MVLSIMSFAQRAPGFCPRRAQKRETIRKLKYRPGCTIRANAAVPNKMPDVKALTQAPLQDRACEMRLDRDRNLLAKPFERPLNLAQLPLDLDLWRRVGASEQHLERQRRGQGRHGGLARQVPH